MLDPIAHHGSADGWRMFTLVVLLAGANPFDTINGLPVHALVVHAVVVLVPLSALGAIGMALVPKWSVRFGVLVWPLALIATGFAFVADKSGKQLALRVGKPMPHAELGEQMKYFAAALAVVTFVLWFVDRRATGRRSVLTKILAVIVIAVALVSCVWIYRVGDSGAKAVWTTIIQNTTPKQ